MIKESTKALWRLNGGWKHPLLFLHAYFYLARTHWYVGLLIPPVAYFTRKYPDSFGKKAMRGAPPIWHSKVLIPEHAKKLVTLKENVSVDDEVCKKVLPFKLVRKIIFENPDNIVVVDCGCRVHVGKCKSEKYGLNVCMVIGDPQASFVLEHSTLNPVKVTPEEALDRIDDYHKSGFVATFWFKHVFAGRNYVICNCCKCCGSAMLLQNELYPLVGYTGEMIVSSGYLATIDEPACKGCSACVKWCPFNACSVDPVTKKASVDYKKCHGCSVCIDKCPNKAMTLVPDPARGMPVDMDAIKEMQPIRPQG